MDARYKGEHDGSALLRRFRFRGLALLLDAAH
jgi:hypothetical protein